MSMESSFPHTNEFFSSDGVDGCTEHTSLPSVRLGSGLEQWIEKSQVSYTTLLLVLVHSSIRIT